MYYVLSHLLALVLVSSFLARYIARKYKIRTRASSGNNGAPKAPGAWPLIGHLHLLSGQLPACRALGLMADKYGPIFQLQLGEHPALVVSSWEMAKDCFTSGNDKTFATRPRMALSKYIGYNGAIFAFAPYGPYWRDIRKMVTLELLTSTRLEKLKHVRTSEVSRCIKELYDNCSNNNRATQVNLSSWFENITFNIIVRMLTGKRFSSSSIITGCMEEMHFKESIKKVLFLSGAFVFSDAIPSLEWMDIGGHIKAMRQTFKEVDTVLDSWLIEHIQKRKDCCHIINYTGDQPADDFIDTMLSILPEESMESGYDRDAIIKATTLTLIMTASESTGETLIWALSMLLNNTRSLKSAQDELDEQVGRNRWVQESDIKNLPYLQAIVKETLRLYPPGPLSGPREAIEDCYVGKCLVKKGTRLIVNLWKIQRDPRIWKDPDEFKPERWFLEEHSNVNFRGQNFEYIPFSSGRRMCPGLTFGTQVVHLTLARLLHGFNISMPMEEAADLTEGLGLALPKVKPLQPLLSPRLTPQLYQSL